MTLEQALIFSLRANASLQAVVGQRVHAIMAPQNNTRPYITLQRISGPREHHLTGKAGFAYPTIQFDCIGDSYLSAKTVAKALRLVLDGIGTTVFGDTGAQETVSAGWLESERDDFEGPSDGSDRPTHRVSMDFLFAHRES